MDLVPAVVRRIISHVWPQDSNPRPELGDVDPSDASADGDRVLLDRLLLADRLNDERAVLRRAVPRVQKALELRVELQA